MGKYDKIIGKLPRMLDEEPKRQEKINAMKDAILQPLQVDEETFNHVECQQLLNEALGKLDLMMDLFTRMTNGKRHANELARAHAVLRRVGEDIDERESKLHLILDAVNQLIVEQYEVESTKSLTLENGDGVAVQHEPYTQTTDRDAVREWAIKTGLERSLTLPWQALNTHVKELMLLGEPAPPGTKVWARAKIVFKRG